jgi:uncharacterized repeat protein (TIGR04076 family)
MTRNTDDALQRRRFLSQCGLGALSLGVALTPTDARSQDAPRAVAEVARGGQQRRVGCRLTVLRTTLNKDFIDRFRNGVGESCPIFKEGQEFVLRSPWESPQGFCDWAWADIRSYVLATAFGRAEAFPPPFGNPEGVFVACCSDGFRPVFFKIERTEI